MPLTSQTHVPQLIGEDEKHIKYSCPTEEYDTDKVDRQETSDGVVIAMARRKADGKVGVLSCSFPKASYDGEKAKAWMGRQKFAVEPAEMFFVKGVEIFSTGTWNGHQITDAVLDQIVSAFSTSKIRPALKLGHDDGQKLLQNDGLPAAGWVENVRKVGSKLVADFVDIPKKIFQLLKNNAYRKVSCEIYNNVKIEDKTYPKLLGAVALLGADLPGVMNLNDILSMYAFDSISKFDVTGEVDKIVVDVIPNTPGENIMSEHADEFKAKAEQLEKDLAAAKAEADKYKKQAEDATVAALEAAKKEQAAKVDAFITEVKADKLCTPAMEGMVRDLVGEAKETYSVGESKTASRFDLVKAVLKASAEAGKVNFSETTAADGKSGTPDLNAKIEKYAADNKVSYRDAYRAVMRDVDATPETISEEERE